MASVSYQIANLLEKMTSNDKDFRFMATNDLMTELQKDSIKLDDDSERKVVKMLLRLLEDKNGEVQNLAVKCLGPLVNKVKEYQVEGIVDTLCANMLSDTEQLRDISSIGLKTVISELPLGSNTLAANVCKKITGKLSSAIEKQEDVSVQLEALDILADLLSRFGGLLISFHPMLLNSLLPQLASPRQAVRKRTIVALSHLVMSCNSSLYNKLIDHLLEGLGSSTSSSVSRTHIQCIASIWTRRTARAAGRTMRWKTNPSRRTRSQSPTPRKREENVKCDILSAYTALLRATRPLPALQMAIAPPDSNSPQSLLHQRCTRRAACDPRTQRARPRLRELLVAAPGCLADHAARIETLVFVVCLVRGHSGAAMRAHVPALMPAVLACVHDPFYKVTAEALRVLQTLVKVMRPLDNLEGGVGSEVEMAIEPPSKELQAFIPAMYECTLVRLRATDMDQEVKERAIAACGQLLCHFGDYLQPELPVCLPIFLERLRNEITRLTTVKALTKVASSPLRIDLRPILPDAVPILGSFLRKNQRALKLSTLVLLDTLVQNYSNAISIELLSKVLMEVPALVNESDLHCAQTALTLAMLGVLSALVAADVAGCSRRELLALLVAPVHRLHEHNANAHHIKQCVAEVVVDGGPDALVVVPASPGDAHHIDLSSIPDLKEVLLNSFTSSSEEVKSAASYALGSVAVGNLPEFLPFILGEIEAQPKRHVVISCESCSPEGVEALRPFIPEIWVQLSKHCQCAEEGSRNVVAECLGKLCLLEPKALLPHLKEFLKSPEPLTRTTAVTAVKFTISDQPQVIDPLLRECMPELLVPLRDPELGVRRVALVAFNSAAHNKPSLIRELLPQVLPTVYAETKVKKELIREVEMGPFKHSVDDGLDLRKAAFECMYTLLGTCLDRLDVFEFLRHVEDGLRDHYDIKMLTYLMCARLAQLCPAVVLQIRVPAARGGQPEAHLSHFEFLRHVEDGLRDYYDIKMLTYLMCARLAQLSPAVALQKKNPHLMDFVTQIKSFPDLLPIFESILKDSSGAGVDSNLMDQS
ncbi:putative Cullin-associated NEDD8-dissociated protein 1 [Operophtera brumata]|uniref:Putative Cullin-associated NEDD8-dissociated protein 1 n=1 Tax=Operophtera brumata TaxID=104452 RepID=A0A0L7LER2_OPEBR|nr:putative Cullin-associated NEDD8-dissociated protein 1 [Operophtera brumata]